MWFAEFIIKFLVIMVILNALTFFLGMGFDIKATGGVALLIAWWYSTNGGRGE